MKEKRICIILLGFVLCLFCVTPVLAMDTGFETDILDKETEMIYLNDSMRLLTEEPPSSGISCFAVNEKGFLAIGFEGDEEKCIGIYDEKGIFQYGYAFDCNGAFGVEWDNEQLIVYFIRGSVVASYDKEGKCLECRKVKNTVENNAYRNHHMFVAERRIGDTSYYLKKNMGILNVFSAYSQLIKVDMDGKETILYDSSGSVASQVIMMVILNGTLITCVIVVLINYLKKVKRNMPT